MLLIYKILPRPEWENFALAYEGSADDRRDGFIHLSTAEQLPQTLARHYAGQRDLMLLAVDAALLGADLKWEFSPKRDQEFPHLYAALPRRAVLWARAIKGNTLPL